MCGRIWIYKVKCICVGGWWCIWKIRCVDQWLQMDKMDMFDTMMCWCVLVHSHELGTVRCGHIPGGALSWSFCYLYTWMGGVGSVTWWQFLGLLNWYSIAFYSITSTSFKIGYQPMNSVRIPNSIFINVTLIRLTDTGCHLIIYSVVTRVIYPTICYPMHGD